MNLFQHLPMPLPLDDDVFLMVDADHDTIAVSNDNSLYRLTSITEPVSYTHLTLPTNREV